MRSLAVRPFFLLHSALVLALAVGFAPLLPAAWPAPGWRRHTIDASSQGADGVRLADANGDGRPDIVTGWEEGGRVRVYLHPGTALVKQSWPQVEVGQVASPEDAVLVDLDGDGAVDVLSASEGDDRSIYVHWAPAPHREQAWRTEALPALRQRMRWMFLMPAEINGRHGTDFFAAGKDAGAAIGWMEAPENPRALADWTWHPLREAGWVMSLRATDMDGDGRWDLLFSDRRGLRRGVCWLQHPGEDAATGAWKERCLSPVGTEEWMFLTEGDLDGDGLRDVIVAAKPQQLHWFRRLDSHGRFAPAERIAFPEGTGTAKAVTVADLNGDGKADLAVTCEHAKGELRGVFALLAKAGGGWEAQDVGGEPGTKFDLVQALDLDGDGDLDLLTCEEAENLGVIWYENPTR